MRMRNIILCSVAILFLALARSQEFDYELEEFETGKSKDGCGQTYAGLTKSFHLNESNLPHHECLWYIKPPTNASGITLFLHILFLHEDDEIYLYRNGEDAANDTNQLLDSPIRYSNGSITLVTDEKQLVVKLNGTNTIYNRTFEALYSSLNPPHFPIPPHVATMFSPIHIKLNASTTQLEVHYDYTVDEHFRNFKTFVFEQFNFSSSSVEFKGSSLQKYSKDLQIDIFPILKHVSIAVKMPVSTNETYRLRMQDVDSSCSKHIIINTHTDEPFRSPVAILNNGSFVTECHWIFEHTDKKQVLSIDFQELQFESALDILAINDGASELSPPLLQVTTSNMNYTKSQVIRTQGPYAWIAFKPITYGSTVSGRVTEHGTGGYFKRNGTINLPSTVKNDTVFELEVDTDQIVYLNFTESNLKPDATLSIYDGFDKSNLLATLHGNIWYPVLSQTSKMMIIAVGFSSSSFKAEFKGVSPGCLHMSTLSNENYILSGNCNATCVWVIPPQDRPGSELLLNLQYIALSTGDSIKITQLDGNRTQIGTIDGSMTHIPQLVIPANVGAVVEINRTPCPKDKDDIVLVGHSSYVPACGRNLTIAATTKFQITSPLYPDTYPIYGKCLWRISTPKENIIHLAFNTLNLAPHHCVKILSSNTTQQYMGGELPEDLFLSGESSIEFDSTNCGKSAVTDAFQSSRGFVVNGTAVDCGGVYNKTTGDFSVLPNKTLCIWKISVPESDTSVNNDVNIISYTINKKDKEGNYELHVYDGSSVREDIIKNDTAPEIWSKTSKLIFIYKRIDASKPSGIISVKYSTISCNATNQCDNKLCLHPDWRCNGVNDCGDFSDERNCASVPIPPEIKQYGYSALTFWLVLFIMLITGVVLGVAVPYCYERYKNGQYRRFGDFSVVQ